MLKCGLLGKKLGHSYSPQIHGMLGEYVGEYEYLLYEKSEEELGDFVRNGDWRGLNVTIPYKKAVLPFCDSLSETAQATGSVNTLTKDENGRIRGDNTDVYGFLSLVRWSGIDVMNSKNSGQGLAGPVIEGTGISGNETSGTAGLGSEAPDTETPDTEAVGAAGLGSEAPDSETPDTEAVGTAGLGSEAPDSETPDTEAVGAAGLGSEAPEAETPDTEAVGAAGLGSEAPEAGELKTAAAGKKVLVLGSGGASASVCYALRSLSARVIVISRSGENNYENLSRHADADVIVNTTPVGMYPDNGSSPLMLDGFPKLTGVLDIIYNPARTGILLQAERRSIPNANGLYMLVAQAKKSSELFTGNAIPDEAIGRITDRLAAEMLNIVLIGMPGSGKSTIARILSEQTGREIIDTDEEIVRAAGMSIPEIMERFGQADFRARETRAILEAGKRSGVIISTGGGCVLYERNKDPLRQNGRIFRIIRDTKLLARHGRPLSEGADLEKMLQERDPYYKDFADAEVLNDKTPAGAAKRVVDYMLKSGNR